jgi:hypothetical protein
MTTSFMRKKSTSRSAQQESKHPPIPDLTAHTTPLSLESGGTGAPRQIPGSEVAFVSEAAVVVVAGYADAGGFGHGFCGGVAFKRDCSVVGNGKEERGR